MYVFIVSLLAGMAAAMGLGGGSLLIIYLTAFAGISQIQAQGINLVFFIPAAVLALILHSRERLVDWRKAIPAAISGAAAAIAASRTAGLIEPQLLKKLFAVFIIIMGMKEIFHAKLNQKYQKNRG